MREPPFDLGPRRILPALPTEDPVTGPIRWASWERALTLSHVDGSCETCAYPGPMRTCMGESVVQPPPRMVRVERSSRADRRPSRWVRVQEDARWLKTHWAARCPWCDEMYVWRMYGPEGKEWTQIHYHPYTTVRAVPPRDDVLF